MLTFHNLSQDWGEEAPQSGGWHHWSLVGSLLLVGCLGPEPPSPALVPTQEMNVQ